MAGLDPAIQDHTWRAMTMPKKRPPDPAIRWLFSSQ